MEGANEAARRAVNAILERSGSDQPSCTIWNLHEPEALAPLRAYDRARYRAGLPWDERFPKAIEAALALGQGVSGVTTGGAGPLAVAMPLAEVAHAPGSPLADPVVARALSLIGLPENLLPALGEVTPGLGAPVPRIGLASGAAELATAAPPRRVRVTQKA
jgi:hypothetical protein